MKKSLIVISALIAASAILFTSCDAGKSVIKDVKGNKHELVEDENGDVYQDYYGNVFEYKTDKEGNKISEVYSYPEVVTNKSRSVIENCWVKVDVPKGWEGADSTTTLRMNMIKGECVDVNQSGCQVDFETFYDMSAEEKYDKYKKNVDNLYSISADIRDVTEFETEICGKAAKAISYRINPSNTTVYYYVMSSDYFTFTIKATVYDKCYTDSQAVVDFLASCITMKNVVNQTTTTAATQKGE